MIVVILSLLLFACQLEPKVAPDFNLPLIGARTIVDALQWTATHITYWPDTGEYWKTPEQTYHDRYGDCEDFALLAMYFIKKEVHKEPILVFGCKSQDRSDVWHAWIKCDGLDYSAQTGGPSTWARTNYPYLIEEYDYQTAMNLAYVRHSRRLGGN
jgi:hypothetical protein